MPRKTMLHAAKTEQRTWCGRDVQDVSIITNGLPTCGQCRNAIRGLGTSGAGTPRRPDWEIERDEDGTPVRLAWGRR